MCAYLDHDVNLNSRPVIYHDSDVDHVVSSNLIGQLGPARRLSDSRPGNETSVFADLVGIWHER